MTDSHEDHHASKSRWVFYGFLAIAGFLLITEHQAHLLGILPYLILLACPLMHLFMHHGHGNHEQHEGGHDHHAHDKKPGGPQ
jgi:hypothetical protein